MPPESESIVFNMNYDWKFLRAPEDKLWPLATAQVAVEKNGKQFYEVDYDDSDWETVGLPHAISASQSFAERAVDGGDTGIFRGIAFYRKKFTLPKEAAGKKIFVEFESARQAIYIWVNGEKVGYYEAGITASGFDLTEYIKYGEENVIAVANDSTSARNQTEYIKETIPGSEWGANDGVSHQWNTNDFNPTQAGLTGNVLLHVKPDIYQTLPLYNNLKTTGFRKVEYIATGGLRINDEYVFLTGYAQRSTNEWAAVGVANDWLAEYDMELVKESNANYIRWMHVAAKPVQIRSGEKYGIVSIMPAGDKEGDKNGREWSQRVEAMRDALIYFRNSPSVLFW